MSSGCRAAYDRSPNACIGGHKMPVKTNIKVSTLSYVIIYVKDPEKSLSFYRDILGAKTKVESPEWIEFEMGATTLALHKDEGTFTRGNSTIPVFPVDNIDEAYKELKAAGVKIVVEPKQVCETPEGPGYSTDVEDRDGNVFSFFGI